MALAFVTIARRQSRRERSLIAALIWMTNFGMIEKGRLIEIEALYVSLFGLALICWLSWWQERRSAWLSGLCRGFFLARLLAKGPLHLLFLLRDRARGSFIATGELRHMSHARRISLGW